jgi:hypothetical protein
MQEGLKSVPLRSDPDSLRGLVRLIEAHGCLGGMGTAGMVPAFMQFFDGVNFLAGGIGRQILDALREAAGSVPVDGIGLYSCMSEQDHTCGKSG